MVLHGIFTILKLLGSILVIFLIVILFLLILLLFVPVRYEVHGENDEKTEVQGKIHWLFHIVSYRIEYKNEEMQQVLRIFGVPVWKK